MHEDLELPLGELGTASIPEFPVGLAVVHLGGGAARTTICETTYHLVKNRHREDEESGARTGAVDDCDGENDGWCADLDDGFDGFLDDGIGAPALLAPLLHVWPQAHCALTTFDHPAASTLPTRLRRSVHDRARDRGPDAWLPKVRVDLYLRRPHSGVVSQEFGLLDVLSTLGHQLCMCLLRLSLFELPLRVTDTRVDPGQAQPRLWVIPEESGGFDHLLAPAQIGCLCVERAVGVGDAEVRLGATAALCG